jgi:hypothetical protein
MAVYLSPLFGAGAQLFTAQGVILAGGTIEFYLAGTTTPQSAYTDSTGTTPIGVVATLDSAGRMTTEIWLTGGIKYKMIVKNSAGVQQGIAWDFISGINDPSGGAPSNSEWVTGTTPTFISPTQFSVAGDQTALYPVGQRVRYTVTAGTGYGTVTARVFGTVTTVTVQADSTPLDSGMSVIAYGLLNAAAPSVSAQGVAYSSLAADTTVPSVGNTLKRVDRSVALTTSTGSSTVLVLTPAIPLGAYATNAPMLVKFHITSGAAPTMNVSGLGALNLKQINSAGAKVVASFTAGQIAQIIYDGTDLVVMLTTSSGRYLRTVVITVGGTYTKGTDANMIEVEGVGGGGGAAPIATGTGGGGSGGYFRKTIAAPAASYTVGIGTAGSAAGSNGGNTTFDVLCTGLGGAGATGVQGGLGGTATGGDINIQGDGGGVGFATTGGNNFFGHGGGSFFGGGAPGQYNQASGIAGQTNSGGGASGGTSAGAIGGTGIVVVREYS